MTGEAEALARKAASERLLQSEGVPFVAHLPAIETAAETTLRTADAIVDRVFSLIVVSAAAIGDRDHEYVSGYMGSWTCTFTPHERQFLDGALGDRERTQLSWRVEAIPPLLWAIQRIDVLPRPSETADFRVSRAVIEAGPSALAEQAKVRDVHAILDAADLIYRYHWAVRNALLKGESAPTELNPGVVYERHRALNWLIGYQDEEWDDVSTDT